MMTPLLFSTFEVTTQAFYRAPLSYAIVNLKPIVPGRELHLPTIVIFDITHELSPIAGLDVLVVPKRNVPRLADLDDRELACLMTSIKRVGSVVQKVYGGDGLTIACQDGQAAGQSVPHVHFHLLPRKFQGDPFSGKNDEIYPELERNEAGIPQHLKVDADEDRKPRSLKDMEDEAAHLTHFFTEDTSK